MIDKNHKLIDIFLAISEGIASDTGGSTGIGLDFTEEIRLTDNSFDVRRASIAGGYFLGDSVCRRWARDSIPPLSRPPTILDLSFDDGITRVDESNRNDVFFRAVDVN